MKLYWTPASPFVRKVMVTAIELGVAPQIEVVPTFWPHEWGTRTITFEAEFIAANPIGRIPALVTNEGIAIAESNWICDYFQSLVEGPRLIPEAGRERWQCIRLIGIADGALEAMIARRAELLRPPAEQSADFVIKQRERIARCLDTLEREFDWLEGTFTLAQIGAAVACGYMEFRYREDQWRTCRPRLAAWYDVFAKRPSMLETIPAETPQTSSLASTAG